MDIVKNKIIYFALSGVLALISLVLLLMGNLNLGIDMTGGVSIDYNYENTLDIEKVQNAYATMVNDFTYEGKNVINNIEAYKVTGENTISVLAGIRGNFDEKTEGEIRNEIQAASLELMQGFDKNIQETNVSKAGKTFGDYIRNTAFMTLGLAAICISLYIYFAFTGTVSGISSLSFAGITLGALIHDVLIAAGLYILVSKFFKEFQIDTYFVTALLTIIGYSINDTIVVFDRLRENLRRFGGKKAKKGQEDNSLYNLINKSIKETITRSIYTSLTLMFVLITIFFFGPEALKGFILVMIFGTIVGTYSSIFFATPLLYVIYKDKTLEPYVEKVVNPEDKIVV